SRPDVPRGAGLTVPRVSEMVVDLERMDSLVPQASRPRGGGRSGGANPGTRAQPGTGSGQPRAGQAPRLDLRLTDEEIDLFFRLSDRMQKVYDSFRRLNAELKAKLEKVQR